MASSLKSRFNIFFSFLSCFVFFFFFSFFSFFFFFSLLLFSFQGFRPLCGCAIPAAPLPPLFLWMRYPSCSTLVFLPSSFFSHSSFLLIPFLFHSVPLFTVFLSAYSFLCVFHFFFPFLSLRSFLSVSFTLFLSLRFFHSVPSTLVLFTLMLSLFLSLRFFHPVPFTVSFTLLHSLFVPIWF